jgi:hypothetical protein
MDKNIHEVLPCQLIEKILTQHCDMKTIYRFQATSSAGNTQFIKEYPDKIRENILQQAFENTRSYFTFLQEISNDQTSNHVLFKEITKRFADVLMECFLEQADNRGTGMQTSDMLRGNHIRKICLQVKQSAQVNNTQLMNILRAFQRDIPIPTNLRQQSEVIYDTIKNMCFIPLTRWKILMNNHEFYVDFKANVGSWTFPLKDVDKVKQIMKPDVFALTIFGDKRPNDASVSFKITKGNIKELARLIKNIRGNGVFLETNFIKVRLGIYDNSFISKVMFEIYKMHFKNVIKI